jgi:hypothetical protein
MPGGLIKTIMRFGGTGADHQRWPVCRTQVKHRNQDISSNITPGASRVFLGAPGIARSALTDAVPVTVVAGLPDGAFQADPELSTLELIE